MAGKYSIRSLILALLVFVSSSGVYVDIHLCQGDIKSFSLFSEAVGCSTMKKANNVCANQSSTSSSFSKKSCCVNKDFFIKQTLELKNDAVTLIDGLQKSMQSHIFRAFVIDLSKKYKVHFRDEYYVPPPNFKSVAFFIFNQVFRN